MTAEEILSTALKAKDQADDIIVVFGDRAIRVSSEFPGESTADEDSDLLDEQAAWMSHPSNTALYERMGELMPYIRPAELQRLNDYLESNDLDAAHQLLRVLEPSRKDKN